MKKRFVAKKRRRRKIKIFFFFVLFIFGMILSFRFFSQSNIKVDDKEFVSLLIQESNVYFSKDQKKNLLKKIWLHLFPFYRQPTMLLSSNYPELVSFDVDEKQEISSESVASQNEEELPLIYLYNSHQTEEYAPSDFLEYSLNPTVMMADYILQDVFQKNGFFTLVEENKIKDILNENSWKYGSSYRASRILLEQAKKEHSSLQYFIDVHRDSLPREKTVVEINGKMYAKVIFLIGLENGNYQENLSFTKKINDKLDERYPGLSKGIYQKGGEGVNGVYNQDFSPQTILIEIGGYQNTTTEVLNSTLAFSECFMEVIRTI